MITMDEFEDLLNEGTEVKIAGKYKIGHGTILRKVDPVMFHVEYHTYCAEVEEAIEEENAE